ncbi:type II/IV secretion system ATPase subunit [Candidatus Pacearchaeota archaeon]|nr:type II/IV secretion system ATPase subunit [Candidatus Pacearchaeota archaeon]
MIFNEKSAPFATEIERRQGEDVLYINLLKTDIIPSIADDARMMERVIDALADNPNVSRIVFVQQRNYNYHFEQISLLAEIARVYHFLVKQEQILSMKTLSLFGNAAEIFSEIRYFLGLLKQDPISCYVRLKRKIAALHDEIANRGIGASGESRGYLRLLERFLGLLEQAKLIKIYLEKYLDVSIDGREIYKRLFRPDILPNFTFTRLMAQMPEKAEMIDQYNVQFDLESASVTILKKENEPKYYYHVLPPEYVLSEEQYFLLHLARGVLIEYRPKAEEFIDPEKTRQVFFNVAKDLLGELAQSKKINLNYRELINLARILVRYTIGYGLIEVVLADKRLQDVVLNAPISQNPIFVRHEKYDECVTNILPSFEDAESWATKLRLQSGRPLDEANPVLDSDLAFGNVRARVAAVKEPLSPSGLAFAFRRHRDEPWTLPLFIKNKMINSFTAGLLSFLIDGNRSLLVAGSRSSGKTSVLGALMLEIMSKYRTIVIEDTPELSVDAMRKIGYDILRMKVRSALVEGSTEIEASEGIRTSLRLGDSALIVGEVRSLEAKALWEAMRVGALANVVAGTIHGDSPYGVFDRVVNDLGVPATSFKATDLIVIANPVKTPDGLHSNRRVISLTEVRKKWIKDPLEEAGFVDLLRYNVDKDELEPTAELINGDSEIIKAIASGVKGWAGNWDAVYDNILLRGKCKQEIVFAAEQLGKPQLLEAAFNVMANNAFHRISDEAREEKGLPWSEDVFPRWKKWMYDMAKEF